MTIGRILERLEADLRAMTASRDVLRESHAARDAELQAMTAERDKLRALNSALMAGDQSQVERLERALATCEEERDDWRQKWTEIAQRVAAEAAADDFGYFW